MHHTGSHKKISTKYGRPHARGSRESIESGDRSPKYFRDRNQRREKPRVGRNGNHCTASYKGLIQKSPDLMLNKNLDCMNIKANRVGIIDPGCPQPTGDGCVAVYCR